MTTLKQHLTENYTHNELADLANHGAVGGFGDFVYHSSTTAYFEQFKDDCFECIKEWNDNTGDKGLPQYVNDNSEEYHLFANSMIWWAIEYIAREITDGEYIEEV
jgi:hypothetical protein